MNQFKHLRKLERRLWWSSTLKQAIIFALALWALAWGIKWAYAEQAQSTFRDSSGRSLGTMSTDSQGTTTFRDATGRTTGTATTDKQGNSVFRDNAGRTTGTSSAPIGGRR